MQRVQARTGQSPGKGKGDDSLRISVICESVLLEAIEEEARSLESKKNNQNSRNVSKFSETKTEKTRRIKSSSDGDKPYANPEDEEIILEEVQVLRLSYRNILKIDNLSGLEAIHTLCLDNNIIEEICNLEHLVNLVWLDLSFNNISKIEGLDKLTKLKDLSLYNNNIETIENLDNCTQLECLSIGKNRINKLENIVYLRQFKNLRLLTIESNPVCNDPECRLFILAYLPALRYLDYALVDEKEVISAKEQNQDELLEAQEREVLEEQENKLAAEQADLMKRLKEANLVIVHTLFNEMFGEDKEIQKVKILPGFDSEYENYRHEVSLQVKATINKGLELHQVCIEEIETYQKAIEDVTSKNEQISIKLVEKFTKTKKKLIQSLDSSGTQEEQIAEVQAKIESDLDELHDQLMSIELQQVEQLLSLRDTLENRLAPGKNERLDRIQNFFRAVEDLENAWFKAVEELAESLMEKLNNGLLEDVSDEVSNILSDRDSLLVAVQGSHDVHLGKLLAQEDLIRDGLTGFYKDTIESEKSEHTENNRARVGEIMRLVREGQQEILALEGGAADEDD